MCNQFFFFLNTMPLFYVCMQELQTDIWMQIYVSEPCNVNAVICSLYR